MERGMYKPEHNQPVRDHIGNAEVERREWIFRNDIFQDKYSLTKLLASRNVSVLTVSYHRASQTACHQSKPEKQHEPRLPCHSSTLVAVAISGQPSLLNRIDDKHPKRRAYSRYPVHKFNMNFAAVPCRVREGRRIDEEEET